MPRKSLIILLLILAIAAFFRLWQLDSIPPGLYPDVAMNGNDALQSLKTGHFKLFYPANNGSEGLMMWLIALSFLDFGVSVWSIKIVAAVIGILTVLGLYLLAKELFSKINEKSSEPIALLSSFFLAASFWHTNFSRIGFRAILLPFILVFSFYFLFKGLHNKKFCNFITAGIIFGLGFYTYTSFRLAPLILFFILIPYWFIYKKESLQKKYLFLVACFLLLVFIIALPLGLYFLAHRGDFISRAAPISIFAAASPIKELIKSLALHLGMFNIYGDPNWRHNFAGSPMLPRSLGLLFLIGLVYSIVKICKSIKNKLFFKDEFSIIYWFFAFLVVCDVVAWNFNL